MTDHGDLRSRPTDDELSAALADRARRLRPRLDALPLEDRSPEGRAVDAPSRRSVLIRGALAAAAIVVLVVGAAVVLDRPDDRVNVGGSAPSGTAETPATVPADVGELQAGQSFPGVPRWLVEFVTTRGGVDAFPVVEGDRYRLDSLGVVCPLPVDRNQPSPALNDAPSCTFVYRFANSDGDGEDAFDLCLRAVGDESSACQSELATPGPTVVEDGVEYLYFRRNLDFDTTGVVVTGLGHDWDSLHLRQTDLLTWRLAPIDGG